MEFRAPGKIVVWGEYAVLTGAPACVFALDCYAQVELEKTQQGWSLLAQGFNTPAIHTHNPSFSNVDVARVANGVLEYLSVQQYPTPFSLTINSKAFYIDGHKLGLGSSAAVCNCVCAAFNELLNTSLTYQDAIKIHRQLQGGKGSGLDVAASWLGGAIQFTNADALPLTWNKNIYWQIIWSGSSSETYKHIASFEQWRTNTADTSTLDELSELSHKLCTQQSLPLLAQYTQALKRFDDAASLNIFTTQHQTLTDIALNQGLVYKPCGAGGGDVGMVFSTSPDFAAFNANAQKIGAIPLNLEMSSHGVRAV